MKKLEKAEARKTPEGLWRFKINKLSETAKDNFETQLLDKVRINLEKTPLEDAVERKAFAQAVWNTRYPECWLKGEKVKTPDNRRQEKAQTTRSPSKTRAL